jgi:Family of unknown function (DUF6498)
MFNGIIDSPLFQHPKAWWLPIISLLITLQGIIFLGWNMQLIVMIFWWEVILMLSAAFIRMLLAMDNQPFLNTILPKIGMLFFGGIMGIVFIMLTVAFTFKVFEGGFKSSGFEQLPSRINLLIAGNILGLIVHYFMNGRYKIANPMGELMTPFIHLLVLLAFIMALTMHLIPKFPQLNQALWVGVSIVIIKFIVDMLFSKIREPFKEVFEKNKVEWHS